MPKTRINLSLDRDLADFARIFAEENRTTFSEIVNQYLLSLKRRVEGESTEQILAHPAFQDAMEKAAARLRQGKAKWHTYSEVFDD
jgi:hypothetical protein